MTSINLDDLCFANDNFTVVHCNEYNKTLDKFESIVIVCIMIFGGIIGACALIITCLNKWEDRARIQTRTHHITDIESQSATEYSTCDDNSVHSR